MTTPSTKKTATKTKTHETKGAAVTAAETTGEGVPVETKTTTTETKPADATPVPAAAPVTASVTTASPLAERVAQAMVYIKMAIAILALDAPALTVAERRGFAKLRKGGEKFIPQIAAIATSWLVQIRTQPTAAMLAATQTAATLEPLATLLAGFVQEIQDTGLQANSVSWGTASALYSVLKRMSRKDPTLKTQLAPVADFFKYRNPATKVPKEGTAPGKKGANNAGAGETVSDAGVQTQAPAPNGTTGAHAGSA
jgi:hypothetical protein